MIKTEAQGLESVQPCPFERYEWSGELISVGGCPSYDFTDEDIVRVVCWGSTGDKWDGETAGVLLLRDGRFAGWEASYGPTGNGFRCDAYGGDADIYFANTKEGAMRHISERAREVLNDTQQSPVNLAMSGLFEFMRQADQEIAVAVDAVLQKTDADLERFCIKRLSGMPVNASTLSIDRLSLDGDDLFEVRVVRDPDNEFIWHIQTSWLRPGYVSG